MKSAFDGPAAPPERATARRKRLRAKFGAAGIDALFVSNPHNVRYLTGFSGDDSALLMTGADDVLLTDSRYTQQAGDELDGVEIFTRKGPMTHAAAQIAGERGVKRLGIEAASLTARARDDLAGRAEKSEIVNTAGLVEELRPRKDPDEIKRMKAAVEIAESAFESIRPLVKPGVSELELARELEIAMLRLGAQQRAFETIVLAGDRAAMPHGRPGGRRLKSGDPVLFDWGARLGFYNCDLTRMLFVHKIGKIHKKVYEAALRAQKAALDSIKAGVPAGKVDAAARESLREDKLDKYFTHGVGHGVGLEVHEMPGVRESETRELRMGMVLTVEPGVYMPGRLGVRIEDMVQVSRDGCRILTGAPKDLDELVAG